MSQKPELQRFHVVVELLAPSIERASFCVDSDLIGGSVGPIYADGTGVTRVGTVREVEKIQELMVELGLPG